MSIRNNQKRAESHNTDPEIDSHTYAHLNFDKGAEAMQWSTDCILIKAATASGSSQTSEYINMEPHLTFLPHLSQNGSCANVKRKKLLEKTWEKNLWVFAWQSS